MSPEPPVENKVASHLDSSSIANGVGKTEATSTGNDSRVEGMVSLLEASQLVPESGKEEKGKPHVTDDEARTGVEAPKDDSQLISSASKTPDSFTELFADATTHNDETLHRAINNAYSSQNFFGPAKKLFLQEKDDEKLDIRAKQAVLHLTWTDSRIKEIEREIKVLRRDVDGLPSDFEVKKTSKQPVYQHELKRSTISEFRLNDESKAVPNNQRPAVEVLITDHSAPRSSGSIANRADVQSTNVADSVDLKDVHLRRSETDGILQIPERLRIRSRALLSLLGRISGEDLLSSGFTRNIENPAPVVFLRPFKLFVSYEKEIRAEVGELELKIEKEDELATSATQVPGSKKELPDFDNRDLLADLKLLIQFLGIDLRATFGLRRKIKEGTATHIEFQDMWHLFNPGDIIVDSSDDSKVYRVLSYTVSVCLASIV
jgi:hypothetical protein